MLDMQFIASVNISLSLPHLQAPVSFTFELPLDADRAEPFKGIRGTYSSDETDEPEEKVGAEARGAPRSR